MNKKRKADEPVDDFRRMMGSDLSEHGKHLIVTIVDHETTFVRLATDEVEARLTKREDAELSE